MTPVGATIDPRLEIRNHLNACFHEEIARDVRTGMTSAQKRLPSKYFYDARGSVLFEEICRLPEYYPTRTEMSILSENADRIMESFEGGDLVEMGSGANWKVRRLLDAAEKGPQDEMRYVPVDVSESAIREAARELIDLYPGLRVLGIVADFTRHMHHVPVSPRKLLVLFGGTLGNLDPHQTRTLLASTAQAMQNGDRLLVGLDLLKPREPLEAAYNDADGVTEAFNKNILHVVNRALDADFDPGGFEHVAFFNEREHRVEMHLKARAAMEVEIRELDLCVTLDPEETIHTEICRKFSRESAARMFAEAGLSVRRWFTDPREWFGLAELERAGPHAGPVREA